MGEFLFSKDYFRLKYIIGDIVGLGGLIMASYFFYKDILPINIKFGLMYLGLLILNIHTVYRRIWKNKLKK